MATSKVDMDTTAQVISEYINGATPEDIGESYGIDYWDVIKIIITSGVAEVEPCVWKVKEDTTE